MILKNNIFAHLNEQVFRRYKKTVPYMITGARPDPENIRNRIGFILETDSANFDYEHGTIKQFVIDDEVIEIYSEAEDKVFRKENAALFAQGLLVPYEEFVSIAVTSQNELSDSDITALAQLKNLPQFKKRVQTLSDVAKKRLKLKLEELNRPISFYKAIDD